MAAVEVHDGLGLGVHFGRFLSRGHDEGVQPDGALRPPGVHVVEALLQLLLRRRVLQACNERREIALEVSFHSD